MTKKITSVNHLTDLVHVFAASHSIPVENLVVGGGGALMALGLRADTDDVNLWVEETSFKALAQEKNVICHPMTDTAFKITYQGADFWLRKFNPYHGTLEIGMLKVYDILALIVHKRGGVLKVERPKAKREQDRLDLIKLDEVYREKNKVRA